MKTTNRMPYVPAARLKPVLYHNTGYISNEVILLLAFILILIGFVTLIADMISGHDKTGQTSDPQSNISGSGLAASNNRPGMVPYDGEIHECEFENEDEDETYLDPVSNRIDIPPTQKSDKHIGPVTFLNVNGTICEENQTDRYTLTPEYDGYYNIQISELKSNTYASIKVIDRLGYDIASDQYFYNNDSLCLSDLVAGESYEIILQQNCGYSDYFLTIGCQKTTVDISDYTEIYDSIEFSDQVNVYTFTPELDGQYAFTISEMLYNTYVKIIIYDHLEYEIKSDRYFYSNDSLSVSDLKANETYTIKIYQNFSYSSYTLSVGKQKSDTNIRNNTVITDSIEFCDQINRYLFTAGRDGDVEISISDVDYSSYFIIHVLNKYKDPIYSDKYFYDGDSFTLEDIKKGDTYEIQIIQSNLFSGYTLSVR